MLKVLTRLLGSPKVLELCLAGAEKSCSLTLLRSVRVLQTLTRLINTCLAQRIGSPNEVYGQCLWRRNPFTISSETFASVQGSNSPSQHTCVGGLVSMAKARQY